MLEDAVVNTEGVGSGRRRARVSGRAAGAARSADRSWKRFERVWAIPEALKRTGGNKTHAARLLGITRETLAKKMEKYGVNGKDNSD